MATLADALRGFTPPTESALADPIKEHFRTLPQQLATNQQAMDKTMAGMYKTDLGTGQPNPNYYPEAMGEFTQMMPGVMGSTNAVKTAKALLSAEKQAMLPTSEGGLGLFKGNTPEERAAAQGYIDYYHGTERLDRLLEKKTLDPKRATSGPMAYGTDSQSVASNYATGKQDTSRITNDMGDMSNYFQVSPKDLGYTRQKSPYTVEQTWYHLDPEKQQEILDKARRIGYENPDEAAGKFVVHATDEGAPFSKQHFDYTLQREAKGNPLTALRQLYAESGMLDAYAPKELSDIYKLAGYPHEISQANAPWASAPGVMLGKARITNPLVTENTEELKTTVLPALQEAFKNDRTRVKQYGGADQWDKNTRYTPKQWVQELAKDIEEGNNSYVWTSIPDKVTAQLKKLGYNGIIDTGGKGGTVTGHQVVIPFDPSQVRSKFAAFNPKDVNKPDLLAAGLAIPMVDEKKKSRKDILAEEMAKKGVE